MRAFVGVTDQSWYEFLASRPDLDEVNFWLPGGGPKKWGATMPNEPFLFKTHRPHDRLVGGGRLSDYRQLELSVAWGAFGPGNGAGSLDDMRRAVSRYRREPLRDDEDPPIGCVMLKEVAFWPGDPLPSPPDFAPNIVRGKGYVSGGDPGSPVELALARLIAMTPLSPGWPSVDLAFPTGTPMFGTPRLVAPRLGQHAFAAVLQNAYRMRCAVTGAKIRPALQAAHIKPVAKEGEHRVDNGLLLRADVHIMFDLGYLGVDPNTRGLHVSSQLRSRFGNGDEFYALAGLPIAIPERRADRPKAEFLEWHMDAVFDKT